MIAARGVVAVVVGVGLVAPAGCGQPGVLDVDRAEERIRAELSDTYGVDFGEVSCPAEVRVEEGGAFVCTATVVGGEDGDGGEVDVSVVQTDGEGALEIAAEHAVLSTPRIEADIAETLADRFSRDDVAVTCDGPGVRVEEPEATFSCDAVDGDEQRTVEVLVRDASGALTYTLD